VRVAVLLAAAAAAVVLLPNSAASERQLPQVLTAIANIGTVYWRSDCPRNEPSRWSLGVLIFQKASSTEITFRAGSTVLRRDVDVPDGKTRWFPFRRSRIQRLRLESGSEGGNHVGRLKVNFAVAGCVRWQTPNVRLRTYVVHH
jgi:hypothetical protein